MQPISPEELELIRNPLSRPAWFAANNLPQDQPLVIRDRVFDSTRRLLRDADIKHVRFIGCVFAGFQGYGNNLENVTFEQCRFLGGEFTGDLWQQVRLVRCEAEGPFKLGCADGEIMFEDCTLEGMTKKQGGYGSWSDHFGIATGQDGSACFIRCRLSNIVVRGAKSLKLQDCTLGDISSSPGCRQGELLIHNCTAHGKQSFSGVNEYALVSIKDSRLGNVDMMSFSSKRLEVINSSLSLEFGAVDAKYDQAVFRNVKFQGSGFDCALARFGSLEIDGCEFEAKGLQLYGKPHPRPSITDYPIAWTRLRQLTLRNLTLKSPRLDYMHAGTLVLENTTLRDADLSHGCFDTIRFKQARLEGELKLADTTIRHIDNQGLINQAKVAGLLQANPAAPKPDLAPIDQPPGRPVPPKSVK